MKQLHPLNEVRLPADCTRHANGRWCIAKEDGFSTCMVGAWWSARILACRWGLACMHAKAADTCLLHGITGCPQKKYLVPSNRHPVVSSALSSSLSPCPLPSPAPLLRLSQRRPSPSPAPAVRLLQRLLRPLLRWGDGDPLHGAPARGRPSGWCPSARRGAGGAAWPVWFLSQAQRCSCPRVPRWRSAPPLARLPGLRPTPPASYSGSSSSSSSPRCRHSHRSLLGSGTSSRYTRTLPPPLPLPRILRVFVFSLLITHSLRLAPRT